MISEKITKKLRKGFLDYLLLDDKGFPLAVLEAKRYDKNPLDGKEQSRQYAESINVRYIILSNGRTLFWDREKGNPIPIRIFQPRIFERKRYKPNPDTLINEFVDNDYVALTQKPDYATDQDGWMKVKEKTF